MRRPPLREAKWLTGHLAPVRSAREGVTPRRSRSRLLAVVLLAAVQVGAAPIASIRTEADYRGWGWEAVVMENGLVTLATVPAIGGRIMRYDLGEHASIFVNGDEVGKTHEPQPAAPWPNYGGYKMWPAPQARWGWPPPPILDGGRYETRVLASGPDSVSLLVCSPVERWQTPGLRLERVATMYRGTSRVRVAQTIVNAADTAQSWSAWDVTQQIVQHAGQADFDDFRVYFPLNPDSRYGDRGVRTTGPSEAWAGEVADGVYGVGFRPDGKKLFADAPRGWIAYVDEGEGYAYVKTFRVVDGAPYPDEGARVEVWVNAEPRYLEVEVVSPVVDIEPGDRYSFVEDWWATRLTGPILQVGSAGAVGERLGLRRGRLRGTYGPFHQGRVEVVFLDTAGAVTARGGVYQVTPETPLHVDEPRRHGARVELRAFGAEGAFVGVLDGSDLAPSGIDQE